MDEEIIEQTADDSDLQDFMNDFSGDDGNQTDTQEENEGSEGQQETVEGDSTDSQDGEGDNASSEEKGEGEEEETPEDNGDGQPEEEESENETFTLKINHQEVQKTKDEVIALAQKGADYDRVKAQTAQAQAAQQELQTKLDSMAQYQDIIPLMDDMAKAAGQQLPEFIRSVRVQMKVKNGLSETEATAEVRAEDAERKLAAKTEVPKSDPQQDAKDQAAREVEDFHKNFPDVEITEELCEKLSDDVIGNHMSLTDAYRRLQDTERDAVIAEKEAQIKKLENQLKAEKKNKQNRASSPGSMKDSGGKGKQSDMDAFFSGFNK